MWWLYNLCMVCCLCKTSVNVKIMQILYRCEDGKIRIDVNYTWNIYGCVVCELCMEVKNMQIVYRCEFCKFIYQYEYYAKVVLMWILREMCIDVTNKRNVYWSDTCANCVSKWVLREFSIDVKSTRIVCRSEIMKFCIHVKSVEKRSLVKLKVIFRGV